MLMVPKERDGPRKCLARRGGWKTRLSDQVVRPAANRTDPFCSAGLNATIDGAVLGCPCHHYEFLACCRSLNSLGTGGIKHMQNLVPCTGHRSIRSITNTLSHVVFFVQAHC